MTRSYDCPSCNGTGQIDIASDGEASKFVDCGSYWNATFCNGTGEVEFDDVESAMSCGALTNWAEAIEQLLEEGYGYIEAVNLAKTYRLARELVK